MEPVTGSIFILPFSPSGTLPFPSVFAPSLHNRTAHTSHDAQNSCHQIIRQLREKCIQTQREKYIDSATTPSRPGKQNNNRRVPSAPAYAPPKNTLLYHSG